jgi:hypothetical protein
LSRRERELVLGNQFAECGDYSGLFFVANDHLKLWIELTVEKVCLTLIPEDNLETHSAIRQIGGPKQQRVDVICVQPATAAAHRFGKRQIGWLWDEHCAEGIDGHVC